MKWIKLWVKETFYGTTFQELNVTERGIWFSLLILAGLGQTDGIIELRKGVAYPLETLATLINCKKTLLQKTLDKLINVDKIYILPDKRIGIKNWNKYQSRYEKYYKKKREKDGIKDGIYMPKNQPAEKLADECTTEVEVDKNIYGDSKKPESPKETNPDVKKLLAYYYDGFLAKFGEKPDISGKDGKRAKSLLESRPLGDLKKLLDKFFITTDRFICSGGYGFAFFSSAAVINKLITKGAEGQDTTPSSQLMEGK